MMRFDRFTERAQDAASRAYEILGRYSHSQIDTEHVLLACVLYWRDEKLYQRPEERRPSNPNRSRRPNKT